MADAPQTPPKKTHVQTRRAAAEELAQRIHLMYAAKANEEMDQCPSVPLGLADELEEMLLMGEKRGVTCAIEYLMIYVNGLREKLTHGVANHVQRAAQHLHQWSLRSPNFILKKEEDILNGAQVAAEPVPEVNAAAKKLAEEQAEAANRGPFPVESVQAEIAQAEEEKALDSPKRVRDSGMAPVEETKDGVKVVDKRRFIGMAKGDKE